MPLQEITAKSILRKHKKIDSWFLSRYGMNLYRGCVHNCVYCDGRDETYGVEGEFGRDVAVKTNAIKILERELDPSRKRVPMKKAYMLLGGGVGDSYQPAERTYRLTRQTLELMLKFGHPTHLLTKSILIERDIDLIQEISQRNGAIASFSFSAVDPVIGKRVEPGVASPKKRLTIMETLKVNGIPCGMFLMPVLPYISDSTEHIDASIKAAKDHGADFVIFGGLTLKPGRQMGYYYDHLSTIAPNLIPSYKATYTGDRWGNARKGYYADITKRFNLSCQKHAISSRIPFRLYKDLLELNDKAVVMLEHLDYILTADGQTSPYGSAAYSISQLKEPISEWKGKLRSLRGVGPFTEKILNEIIDTGTSPYFHQICGP